MARTHLFFVLVVIKTASKSHCCPVEIHAAILSLPVGENLPDKIHGTFKAGINDFTYHEVGEPRLTRRHFH
jgi:hypothetical protein